LFLVIEENPNCEAAERVFAEAGKARPVELAQVNNSSGEAVWCHVVGVDQDGKFTEAKAVLVEDSSEGTAWLIFGGSWGLRFRPATNAEDWSLESKDQWGAPFKVLDSSAVSIT